MSPPAKRGDAAHRDDSAEVAYRREIGPCCSAVHRAGRADRVQAGEEDERLAALEPAHPEQRRRLLARRPRFGHGQARRPRPASIVAASKHDRAAPVPLGVRGEDRLAVVQPNYRDVAEVDARLSVHHRLPRRVAVQVQAQDSGPVGGGHARGGPCCPAPGLGSRLRGQSGRCHRGNDQPRSCQEMSPGIHAEGYRVGIAVVRGSPADGRLSPRAHEDARPLQPHGPDSPGDRQLVRGRESPARRAAMRQLRSASAVERSPGREDHGHQRRLDRQTGIDPVAYPGRCGQTQRHR